MVGRIGNFIDSIVSGIVGGIIVITFQEFGGKLGLGTGFLIILMVALIILYYSLISCRKP